MAGNGRKERVIVGGNKEEVIDGVHDSSPSTPLEDADLIEQEMRDLGLFEGETNSTRRRLSNCHLMRLKTVNVGRNGNQIQEINNSLERSSSKLMMDDVDLNLDSSSKQQFDEAGSGGGSHDNSHMDSEDMIEVDLDNENDIPDNAHLPMEEQEPEKVENIRSFPSIVEEILQVASPSPSPSLATPSTPSSPSPSPLPSSSSISSSVSSNFSNSSNSPASSSSPHSSFPLWKIYEEEKRINVMGLEVRKPNIFNLNLTSSPSALLTSLTAPTANHFIGITYAPGKKKNVKNPKETQVGGVTKSFLPSPLSIVGGGGNEESNGAGSVANGGTGEGNVAGKQVWDRSLDEDIVRLCDYYKPDTVVLLLTEDEIKKYQIEDIFDRLSAKHSQVLYFPQQRFAFHEKVRIRYPLFLQ
jgi:hypothetical protein